MKHKHNMKCPHCSEILQTHQLFVEHVRKCAPSARQGDEQGRRSSSREGEEGGRTSSREGEEGGRASSREDDDNQGENSLPKLTIASIETDTAGLTLPVKAPRRKSRIPEPQISDPSNEDAALKTSDLDPESHAILIGGVPQWVCPHCSMLLTDASKWHDHVLSHSSQSSTPTSSTVTSEPSYTVEEDGRVRCGECGFPSRNVRSFKIHAARKHGQRDSCLLASRVRVNGKKLYKCDICGKTLINFRSLQKHQNNKHFKNSHRSFLNRAQPPAEVVLAKTQKAPELDGLNPPEVVKNSTNSPTKNPTDKELYSCKFCSLSFNRPRGLKKHIWHRHRNALDKEGTATSEVRKLH